MRNLTSLAVSIVIAALLLSCQQEIEPVNKNASPEAEELLEYLYAIRPS
jgi:hypothetical protein